MSGGSLDYLCFKEDIGTADLDHIRRAIDRLHDIDDEKIKASKTKAYDDLRELAFHLAQIPEVFEKVRNLLHDIEWTISGDYGEDQLIETLKTYGKK
jgi:hypothetical protein